MWFRQHRSWGLLVTVILLFGLTVPASADPPSVSGQATFTDYPDMYPITPWDIWTVEVSAYEPDSGVLRVWNSYTDWDYVENMDPADLDLPPDTDMKETAKFLKGLIKGIWMEVDIACVNVVDNRAVVGGQITKAGDVYADAGLLDTWFAIEFFDMSADPTMDDYTESLHTDYPDPPEDPNEPPEDPFIVSEQDVMEWCATGDVPVPEDWFYYQTELISGDVEVSSAMPSDVSFKETYVIPRDTTLLPDLGWLNIGCQGDPNFVWPPEDDVWTETPIDPGEATPGILYEMISGKLNVSWDFDYQGIDGEGRETYWLTQIFTWDKAVFESGTDYLWYWAPDDWHFEWRGSGDYFDVTSDVLFEGLVYAADPTETVSLENMAPIDATVHMSFDIYDDDTGDLVDWILIEGSMTSDGENVDISGTCGG